jgi:hypothetical protein
VPNLPTVSVGHFDRQKVGLVSSGIRRLESLTGSLVCQTESMTLLIPARRQFAHALEPLGIELDRMCAEQDSPGDVGGQECDRQDSTDLVGGNAFLGGKLVDGTDLAVCEGRHPAMGVTDS